MGDKTSGSYTRECITKIVLESKVGVVLENRAEAMIMTEVKDRGKNILVTGGAGYIGSHTVVELSGEGFGVVIVDDLSNAELSTIESIRTLAQSDIPFERVDCRDKEAMRGVFERHSIDAVIHFAASKAVGESVAMPLKYYNNNLDSFITTLELMVEFGVENMLFSSSATIYGEPDVLPLTEESPRKSASSPYSNTKQICEDILRDSVAAYENMRGISLRYFNPIGAHPSALLGEVSRGVPSNLVPFITQTAIGIREELSIFGNDYNTQDGTPLRDYINIVDLARAHLYALKRVMGRKGEQRYEVFNIGTGIPLSVLELVQTFERVNGVKVPYRVTARREGDAESLWADVSLANRELGWRAERSVEQSLASAWAWEQRLRAEHK